MAPHLDRRALAAVSAGGALGALARHAIASAWPHTPPGFPWATWTINVSGCFLLGVLLTLIARFRLEQRLLRPFLGVGVLGGYTTFSTAAVEVRYAGPGTGLAYLGATLLGALLAVHAGSVCAALGKR